MKDDRMQKEIAPRRDTLLSSMLYALYATIKEKLPYGLRKSLKKVYSALKKEGQLKAINKKSLETIKSESPGKSKRKRMLVLLNWLTIGGAEAMMFTLLRGLKDKYDLVIVTTSPERRNEWKTKFTALTKKIYLLNEITEPSHFFDYCSKIIKKSRPDLMLLSNSEAGYSWINSIKEENNLKIVDILHNDSSEGFIYKSAKFDKHIDAHVVVGDKIKETLIRNFSIEADKVHVIPNGIDTKRFSPRQLPDRDLIKKRLSIPPDKKIVTFIGRFSGEKRPLRFFRIARKLLRRRDDVYFVMVGDGRERRLVEFCIDFFNLTPHFRLCGFKENIEEYLHSSDCLLATSYLEGFFLTVLEAIAMGVCVVTHDVGEVRKMIHEGKNGFIIKNDKLNNYVNKVEYCLDNLSNKKETILKTFDPRFAADNMIRSYKEIFSEVSNKK